MLYKDGVLDRLDHPVLDFFADRGVANVDDRKKAITIQSLLDMTSGFDWDQGIEDGKEQTLIDMTLELALSSAKAPRQPSKPRAAPSIRGRRSFATPTSYAAAAPARSVCWRAEW
jgi:CubicO group peptidase (beta-lactamase class C family)